MSSIEGSGSGEGSARIRARRSIAQSLYSGSAVGADPTSPTQGSNGNALALTGARIDARQELAALRTDVLEAGRALEKALPSASRESGIVREQTGTQEVAVVTVVTTETEEVTPASSASQTSIAFTSADETVSLVTSELRLDLGDGSEIQIDVGLAGASLQDFADLVNNDSENLGRVTASVIESEGSFRLSISTTETGAGAELTVLVDSQNAPIGGTPSDPPQSGNYALIDDALAIAQGTDETTETIVTEETETTLTTEAVFEDVERSIFRRDDSFEALVTDFTRASNLFREAVTRLTDSGETSGAEGVLANDAEALRIRDALEGAGTAVGENGDSLGYSLAAGLLSIGIETDARGAFSVDSEALQSALADRPEDVLGILVGQSGGLVGAIEEALLVEGSGSGTSGRLDFVSLLGSSDSAARGRLDFLDRIAEIGSEGRAKRS